MIRYFCDRCDREEKHLNNYTISLNGESILLQVCDDCLQEVEQAETIYKNEIASIENTYINSVFSNKLSIVVTQPKDGTEESIVVDTPTTKSSSTIVAKRTYKRKNNPNTSEKRTMRDRVSLRSDPNESTPEFERLYLSFVTKALTRKYICEHFGIAEFKFDKLRKQYQEYHKISDYAKLKPNQKTRAQKILEKIIKTAVENYWEYSWQSLTADDIKEYYADLFKTKDKKEISGREIGYALLDMGARLWKGATDTRDYLGVYYFMFPIIPKNDGDKAELWK